MKPIVAFNVDNHLPKKARKKLVKSVRKQLGNKIRLVVIPNEGGSYLTVYHL